MHNTMAMELEEPHFLPPHSHFRLHSHPPLLILFRYHRCYYEYAHTRDKNTNNNNVKTQNKKKTTKVSFDAWNMKEKRDLTSLISSSSSSSISVFTIKRKRKQQRWVSTKEKRITHHSTHLLLSLLLLRIILLLLVLRLVLFLRLLKDNITNN